MYRHQLTIKLHQVDMAGTLFFAELFTLAHNCYESFLEQSSKSIFQIIENENFLIPIVHAEADYFLPIRLSEKITIEMGTDSTKNTSFVLKYRFINNSSDLVAEVKTIHVTINPTDRKPISIQKDILACLKKIPFEDKNLVL